MPDVQKRIVGFILEKYPKARKQGLTETSPLLDSGIIDSLGVLDLVGFVEAEFAITVVDEELTPENFHSVERLVAFVEAKRGRNGHH